MVYDLFGPAREDGAFVPLVRLWQASERLDAASARLAALLPAPPEPGPVPELEEAYRAFSERQRLRLARETVAWVQDQSRVRYRRDPGGDVWPSLRGLFAEGRDDCDGLELLTFSLLRSRGFGPGELYRAILRNGDAGGYHMVTLWFDADRADPWVLDPTGFVTRPVARLSGIRPWVPVQLFDERELFRAAPVERALTPAGG